MLLFNLPRESLFMQATLGEHVRWSTTDYLIANVIDAVTSLAHMFHMVHRGKGPKPKWSPYKRPGDVDRRLVLGKGGGVTVAELKKRLAKRRAVNDG